MNCPHCASKKTYSRKNKTGLGYQEYRCRDCNRQFNERTGSVFNYFEYPTSRDAPINISAKFPVDSQLKIRLLESLAAFH